MLKRNLSILLALVLAFTLIIVPTAQEEIYAQVEEEDMPVSESLTSEHEEAQDTTDAVDEEKISAFAGFDFSKSITVGTKMDDISNVAEIEKPVGSGGNELVTIDPQTTSRIINAAQSLITNKPSPTKHYDLNDFSSNVTTRNPNANTHPGAAFQFPFNMSYTNHLTFNGAQAWFHTPQLPSNGKVTLHLEVPNSNSIDYDLYMFTYNPSNGALTLVEWSENGPQQNEQVARYASAGEYLFFCVQSYSGFSTTNSYTLYNIFTTGNDGYEANDSFNRAKAVSMSTSPAPTPGSYSYISAYLDNNFDMDFYSFTPSNNKLVFELETNNPDIMGFIYNQSGNYMGLITTSTTQDPIYVALESGITSTMYVLVQNPYKNTSGSYELFINNFTTNQTINDVLGRSPDKRRLAYVAGSQIWVNSTRYNTASSLSLDYTDAQNRGRIQTTSIGSPVARRAVFGGYSSGVRGNHPNALLLVPI